MHPNLRTATSFGREVISEFIKDDCPAQAAALAYYTIFALAPLLVMVMVITGLFMPELAISGAIQAQAVHIVGPEAAAQIRTMVEQVQDRPHDTVTARVLGTTLLLYGSTGVVIQLQRALGRAWAPHNRFDPPARKRRSAILRRLLSFGLILGVAFLLLVSLVVSAVVSAVAKSTLSLLPDALSVFSLQAIDNTLSLLVVAVFFTAMFKFLPEAKVPWRDAAVGALVTSFLFTLGKAIMGVYLGNSNVGTAYGAASSLALVLVWIYYSSMILLLGAEFTQVLTRRRLEARRQLGGPNRF